ncbi:GntR family transcriptional regulator [Frisingicoccus sp.]|uniref:GntR family transcriptional regulator n=1 Tax=Frisingicoccus sp. TaxID=1918627 RepID=UPI003AB21F28
MNIFISNSGEQPIYEQITGQIKEMILRGELKGGDALPSMRGLAKDLHISVITTKRAYEELERDGFIHTMVGKGSFVADANMEMMKEEQFRRIEEILAEGVALAKRSGIDCEELQEIIRMVYEEE